MYLYTCKGSGLEVYETFEELLNKGVTGIWDYQGAYYIRVKLDDQYDSRIWIVNKGNKKVSHTDYIDFMLDIRDKATPVDPKTLRRAS